MLKTKRARTILVVSVITLTILLSTTNVAAVIDFRGAPANDLFDDGLIQNRSFEFWDGSIAREWTIQSGTWSKIIDGTDRTGTSCYRARYTGTSYISIYQQMDDPQYHHETWVYTQMQQLRGKTVEFGFFFESHDDTYSDAGRAVVSYQYETIQGRLMWSTRYGEWTPVSGRVTEKWSYASVVMSIPSDALAFNVYIQLCDFSSSLVSGKPFYGYGNGKVDVRIDDAKIKLYDEVATDVTSRLVYPYGSSTDYGATSIVVSITRNEWDPELYHEVWMTISVGAASKPGYYVSRVVLTVTKVSSTSGGLLILSASECNDKNFRSKSQGIGHAGLEDAGATAARALNFAVGKVAPAAIWVLVTGTFAAPPVALAFGLSLVTGYILSGIFGALVDVLTEDGDDNDAGAGDPDLRTSWYYNDYLAFARVSRATCSTGVFWAPNKADGAIALNIAVSVWYGYYSWNGALAEVARGSVSTFIYLNPSYP